MSILVLVQVQWKDVRTTADILAQDSCCVAPVEKEQQRNSRVGLDHHGLPRLLAFTFGVPSRVLSNSFSHFTSCDKVRHKNVLGLEL